MKSLQMYLSLQRSIKRLTPNERQHNNTIVAITTLVIPVFDMLPHAHIPQSSRFFHQHALCQEITLSFASFQLLLLSYLLPSLLSSCCCQIGPSPLS